jgi:hypothetical protein
MDSRIHRSPHWPWTISGTCSRRERLDLSKTACNRRRETVAGNLAVFLAFGLSVACGALPADERFGPPERVIIEGYVGEAMEPFMSRDGATLVFNNRNGPEDQTDLHWASRAGPARWHYRGLVAGANSMALDGVGTLAGTGRFCFVSTRSYDATLATIHCGDWQDGVLARAALQPRTAGAQRGELIFDVELAADGETMVLTSGEFSGGAAPDRGRLRLARKSGDLFVTNKAADAQFATVNKGRLDYAAALSSDGRQLAFTRLGRGPLAAPEILLATRPTNDAPFGDVRQIAAITGFVEAPSFGPGDRTLVYHRRDGEHYTLWQVSRK